MASLLQNEKQKGNTICKKIKKLLLLKNTWKVPEAG